MANKSNFIGDRVYRFSGLARFVHWFTAASFFILSFTGLTLFTPAFEFMLPLFGGASGAGFLHRVAAVLFIAVPLVALIIAPKGFMAWMKVVTTWGKDDIGFLKAFPKEFFGGHVEMPPQAKFNAGEKINSLLQLSGSIILALSGLVIWFSDYFPMGLVQIMYPLHALAFIITFTAIIGHAYLATLNPGTKEAINGMLDGTIDRKFAESHYPKWVAELEAEEKKIKA